MDYREIRDRYEYSGIPREYDIRLVGSDDHYLKLEMLNFHAVLMYEMDWEQQDSTLTLFSIPKYGLSANEVVDLGEWMIELWDRLDEVYELGDHR